jgi:hypothetical protein
LVGALPVVTALLVYGFALSRWLLAVPLVLALLGATFAGVSFQRSPWKLAGVSVLGIVFGLLFLLQGEMPPSALPPPVLSLLTAALACLACFVVLTGQLMFGWIYGWLLVGLVLNLPPVGPIWIFFAMHLVSTLVCLYVLGGANRLGVPGGLGFVVFIAASMVIALGLTRVALRSEEAMMGAFLRWARDIEPPSGIFLQSEIAIGARSSVEQSMRPLIEVDGIPPDYLRVAVMEAFDGLLWTPAEGKHVPGAPRTSWVRMPPPVVPPPELRRTQTMLLLERLEDIVPAPAGTYAIDGPQMRLEQGWVWRTLGPFRQVIRLHRNARELLPEEEPPKPITRLLPADLRKALEPLAREIVAGATDPREQAERVTRFFQSQFLYSLSTDLSGTEHPLVVLIREKRAAYCIYFASAMASLLRTLGVSTRVVSGFLPTEYNPIDGRTTIRMRDAHAWVEVYLPSEHRYVTFDPTPSRSREDLVGLTRPGWVFSFLGAIGSGLRRAWIALREDPLGLMASIVMSPTFLVSAGLLALWQLRRRQKLGPRIRQRRALESQDLALRRLYRRYLRLLSRRAGIVPTVAETDEELLARLRAAQGDRAGAAATVFLDAYRQARYGGATIEAEEPLRNLEAALRQA